MLLDHFHIDLDVAEKPLDLTQTSVRERIHKDSTYRITVGSGVVCVASDSVQVTLLVALEFS